MREGHKKWTGTQPHKQFIMNMNQVVMRETELFQVSVTVQMIQLKHSNYCGHVDMHLDYCFGHTLFYVYC